MASKPPFVGEKMRLDEICTLVMGQSPESSSYNHDNQGLPFYQGNADFGVMSPTATVWCTEPKKIAESGDILLSVRAPIGAINVAKEKCCIGRGLAAIRPLNRSISREYLLHLLLANRKKLDALGTGSTFKAVGKKILSSFKVMLYDTSSQSKISERLNVIQGTLKSLEKQNGLLDQLIKSRFAEMFEDPIHGSIAPIFAVEDLVPNSKGSLKAGPFGSSLKKSTYTNYGYKIYGQEQVISGDESYGNYYIPEEKYEQLISCKVSPGDVLISLVGTIGKVLVLSDNCEPGIINPRLIKITFDQNLMLPQFFAILFSMESVNNALLSASHGQTMNVLNLKMIRKLKVVTPSIKDQIRFLRFVEEVDKSRFVVQQQIERLQTLYDSLAQEYFGD